MTIQIKQAGCTTLLMCAELERHITPFWFDLNFWQTQQQVLGSAPGRGQSYFLRWLDEESGQSLNAVWRHYKRGGLMAKLSQDRYCYTGLAHTRPYQEFALTLQLYEKGLPVPRPIVAAVHRHGLFYSADFISETIAGTTSMAACLQTGTDVPWGAIGAMIKRFHREGVNHVDLNIRNILLDKSQKPYLIDFDRCRLETSTKAQWQQANLQRLKRSIDKEFSPSQQYNQAFAQLLHEYHNS